MLSFFKKKKQAEPVQAELVDDRREAIEQSREAKKSVKKATPKKKK